MPGFCSSGAKARGVSLTAASASGVRIRHLPGGVSLDLPAQRLCFGLGKDEIAASVS